MAERTLAERGGTATLCPCLPRRPRPLHPPGRRPEDCCSTSVEWCCATRRELVVGGAALDVPGVRGYVERTDFAGAGDELWQSMLRHEITERDFWAQRSGELGRVLGHEGWTHLRPDRVALRRPPGRLAGRRDGRADAQVRAAGLPLVALTNDLLDFHGQDWVDDQDWLRDFDTVMDGRPRAC